MKRKFIYEIDEIPVANIVLALFSVQRVTQFFRYNKPKPVFFVTKMPRISNFNHYFGKRIYRNLTLPFTK
ncbi:MAG: hypothetical protein BGO00_02735 [Alphaproteobacteria bacterium 62-8]|nr:MAG: hypothetical protein BGO00_02735 [Alphaproteobacteria bacterium 62-8]